MTTLPHASAKPLTGALCIGLIFVVIAIYELCTGKTLERGRTILRAKEPTSFWIVVVMHCCVSAAFIGYVIYKSFIR